MSMEIVSSVSIIPGKRVLLEQFWELFQKLLKQGIQTLKLQRKRKRERMKKKERMDGRETFLVRGGGRQWTGNGTFPILTLAVFGRRAELSCDVLGVSLVEAGSFSFLFLFLSLFSSYFFPLPLSILYYSLSYLSQKRERAEADSAVTTCGATAAAVRIDGAFVSRKKTLARKTQERDGKERRRIGLDWKCF